jgi:transcriptional regulator with XRE-family HTH domain
VSSSGIAAAVRAARERLGWTREALAHRAGLSWAAIAQIETGRRRQVRIDTIVALARSLDVSVDYLVGSTRMLEASLLRHRALLYESDDEYLSALVPFLAAGFEGGENVLVVTAARQLDLLRAALGADAPRVEFADSASWYRTPRHALDGYRGFVHERLEHGAPWIRIVGEPLWDGRSQAEVATWVRYESLLNLALASSPATIVCPYDARSVPARAAAGASRTHPQLVDGGEINASAAYREPEDFLLETA